MSGGARKGNRGFLLRPGLLGASYCLLRVLAIEGMNQQLYIYELYLEHHAYYTNCLSTG